jgi:hypothetical protein
MSKEKSSCISVDQPAVMPLFVYGTERWTLKKLQKKEK